MATEIDDFEVTDQDIAEGYSFDPEDTSTVFVIGNQPFDTEIVQQLRSVYPRVAYVGVQGLLPEKAYELAEQHTYDKNGLTLISIGKGRYVAAHLLNGHSERFNSSIELVLDPDHSSGELALAWPDSELVVGSTATVMDRLKTLLSSN